MLGIRQGLFALGTWGILERRSNAQQQAIWVLWACWLVNALLGLAVTGSGWIIAAVKHSSAPALELIFESNPYMANMTGEGFQWLLLDTERGENEPELESKRSLTPGPWLAALSQPQTTATSVWLNR
jgi:hypothetical protein